MRVIYLDDKVTSNSLEQRCFKDPDQLVIRSIYKFKLAFSDVEFFAQPEGCTVLSPLETLPKESVSFVFMLTDVKNNVKRYRFAFIIIEFHILFLIVY